MSSVNEFCYDFEFLSDGTIIMPISLGVVSDDDRDLYLVNEETDLLAASRDPFLRDHVLTSLPVEYAGPNGFPRWDYDHPDAEYLVSRSDLAERTLAFLTDGLPDGGTAKLWAWFSAYDHVALSNLWGRLVDRPAGIPWRTSCIRDFQEFLGDPRIPEQTEGEHNALADAKFNWVRLRELRRVQGDRPPWSGPGTRW